MQRGMLQTLPVHMLLGGGLSLCTGKTWLEHCSEGNKDLQA